jgi:RHS repeat-associated protein
VTTNYVYDGLNPVQEKSGAVVTANLLTGLGLDEFLTRTDGAGAKSLLHDGLGSTVALDDGTGSLPTQYTYEPFGATTSLGQASTNSYKYTGREEDGTGLHYYRARYYSPRMQRFLSEDPIEFAGGDPNLYAYVWNSPLRWNDPLGMEGAVPNPYIQITPGPDGVSLMLEFVVQAPPGTPVTIDVGSKIVFEKGRDFTNTPFKQLPDGYQTRTTDHQNFATFKLNIKETPGYVRILTPGLSTKPTVLTGPVGPGSAVAPCKYTCNVDKSYINDLGKRPQGPKLGGRK